MAYPPKRGRPEGHVLSQETKTKISEAQKARKKYPYYVPTADRDSIGLLTIDERHQICEKDQWACANCLDPYKGRSPGVSHYQKYLAFRISKDQKGEIHLLCAFCRRYG